jgi:hypothetical protein
MRPDRRTRHAEVLTVGIAASAALHFLVLALLRFHAPGTASVQEPVVTFEPPQPVAVVEEIPKPMQEADPVDATAAEMPEVGVALAGAASTAAAAPGSAEPTPAVAPANGDPILAAADVAPEPVLTETVLTVSAPAEAVYPETPETDTSSEELDESVPVWKPGSVGKAKRQWASNGTGVAESGIGNGGSILIGRGGGHCPMPGRGRGRPPVPTSWFN